MKKIVKVRTSDGRDVRIVLDHWGSGLDQSMRRWTLQEDVWQCMDSLDCGDLAEERVLGFWRPAGRWPYAPAGPDACEPGRDDDEKMVAVQMHGQTMVEYALIIAAIGVVVWSAYSLMGHNIGSMASGIDSSLTST